MWKVWYWEILSLCEIWYQQSSQNCNLYRPLRGGNLKSNILKMKEKHCTDLLFHPLEVPLSISFTTLTISLPRTTAILSVSICKISIKLFPSLSFISSYSNSARLKLRSDLERLFQPSSIRSDLFQLIQPPSLE